MTDGLYDPGPYEYLDPDNISLTNSPPLRPVKVNIQPSPSPPPFAPLTDGQYYEGGDHTGPNRVSDGRYDLFYDEPDPGGWDFGQELAGSDYESNEEERVIEQVTRKTSPSLGNDLAALTSDALRQPTIPPLSTLYMDEPGSQSSRDPAIKCEMSGSPAAGELSPNRQYAQQLALSMFNGTGNITRNITRPSISAQLGDINYLAEAAAAGDSAFSRSPPARPPSPGRDHFYFNANSHRRLSQTDGPQYSGYGDYSSSNTETPSTDQGGSTPTTMAIDRMSIDGIINPQIGGFQCTYPGCTALPFQTQYLLNSHANIHSSNRPHYCSVKGCPRSKDGKGFKRKNEMIRHGLVHDSPGYICPFCPDREHKYPRPDILQRHVRVHHVDRDKDDPQLREVLSQRPQRPSTGIRWRREAPKTYPRMEADLSFESVPDLSFESVPPRTKHRDFAASTFPPAFPSLHQGSGYSTPHVRFESGNYLSPNLLVPEEPRNPPFEEDIEYTEGAIGVSDSPRETESMDDDQYIQNISSDTQLSDCINSQTELGALNTGPPATDSGYASTGKNEDTAKDAKDEEQDDARTVCTDNQDFDVPKDVKEQLVAAFSREITQRLQGVLSKVDNKTSMRNTLVELLKDFSLRLGMGAYAGEQKNAVTFIRHYRHRIANLIAGLAEASLVSEKAEIEEPEEIEEESTKVKNQDEVSLAEKILLWNVEKPLIDEPQAALAAEVSDPTIIEEKEGLEDIQDIEEVEGLYAITQFPEAWKFLTDSHSYQWLLSRIRTEVLLTKIAGTPADTIKKRILNGLASASVKSKYGQAAHKARFELSWDLRGFLQAKYPDEHEAQLESLITVVGSGDNVQAMTCAQYMDQVWPVTGMETLLALQGALDKGEGQAFKAIMTDKTKLTIEVRDSVTIALVVATEPAIAEIGQQLAWLAAALRSSPSDHRMAYSTPSVTLSTGNTPTFTFNFQIREIEPAHPLAQTNGSCWRPLFKNPIIVEGYPILARAHGEKGLEIALDMMAGLSQASRVTNFGGGLVIKGFSTMFCPTKRIKDSVLWHYLFSHDGKRMSYLSADILCGGRARIKEVDIGCLEQSRNFLGWASSVEVHIGTKEAKYDEIDWAGSNFASAGVTLDEFSIGAGKIITGKASFTKGTQNIPIHLSHARLYQLQILHAHSIKVVIYDVRDRRGWLVDGTSALLHLTRTQLSSSPYSESEFFNLDDFRYANPKDRASGAKKALLDPRNRKLILLQDTKISTVRKTSKEGVSEILREETTGWTYEDLVQETYHILEQIEDRQTQMIISPSIGLGFMAREKLLGFGFMDIVNGQNILRPRVAKLSKSGWGWVDFIRSTHTITLLGKGFGELIRPAQESNQLCKHWKHVPVGRDHLVACVSTLEDIRRQYGDCDDDVLQLASGIYCHIPDKLYESCECKRGSWKTGCDRVQAFSSSPSSRDQSRVFDYRFGAVIFGKNRKYRLRWPSKGEPVEEAESDSEEEEGSEFLDSGLGGSNSSTSGLDGSSSLKPSPVEEPLEDSQPDRTPSERSREEDDIHNKQPTLENASGVELGVNEPSGAVSELPGKFHMSIRGVKRTLDKVTTQAFSRKKQNTGDGTDAYIEASSLQHASLD